MIIDYQDSTEIRVRSTAKLNLYLEVLGKRPDGYHDLETVFQEISLFDEIVVRTLRDVTRGTIQFSCNDSGLAPPGQNLVERAAALFFESTGVRGGAEIQLKKSVPSGAGLGGGSANATATLQALDRQCGTQLGLSALECLAAQLGSDCAFFVRGGAAIGRGRGEILEPLKLPPRHFLLIVPAVRVATADVYRMLGSELVGRSHVRKIPMELLHSPDSQVFGTCLYNRLENTAFALHPELSRARNAAEGAKVAPIRLTGSGGGLFRIFGSKQEAQDSANRLKPIFVGRSLGEIFVTESLEGLPR